MAIRFRKSFKAAPGVRFNIGKKSAGVTFGGKHFRQSFNTSGRKTTSASIPETGVSFYETSSKKKKGKRSDKKVRMDKEVNREPETVVDDVIELPGDTVSPETSEPPKPKLWLWALMAVVLVCGLWYLFSNGINRPEVSNEVPTSGVITTTQFTYAAEDVELKMLNGALTAFVGDRQVPFTGLVNAVDGTYVVKDGVADTVFNGVYESDGTLRLVKDGKIDTTSSGVVPAGNGDWYLAQNGVVETAVSWIRNNEYGNWYVKDGKVQLDQDGLVQTEGKEYLLEDGRVATSQTGLKNVGEDWVLTDSGVVRSDYTGVQKNEYGRWYVKDGHIDFGYNGVARSDGSTYLVKDGKVDTSQNGVMQVDGTWAYVADGMVAQNYTGVKSNQYGTWYIKNGLVDFAYAGTVSAPDGNRYNVSNGRASVVTTTQASNNNGGGGNASNFNTYDNEDDYSSTYVGNASSGKFHYATCRDVRKMNEGNKVKGYSRSWYISHGYSPCGHCHP